MPNRLKYYNIDVENYQHSGSYKILYPYLLDYNSLRELFDREYYKAYLKNSLGYFSLFKV